jgi:hypothetical protein
MTKISYGLAFLLLAALSIGSMVLSTMDEIPAGVALPVDGAPDLSVEADRSRRLDSALAVTLRCRDERTRIISRFENGSLTLDEAIAEFLPLTDQDSGSWGYLTSTYPDSTAEELIGYQMLITAYARPGCTPGKEDPFLKSLVSQIRERFGDRTILPPNLMERIK